MAKREKQIVDFNRLRKRRQRTTTFKRLVVLAGIVLLLFVAISLNNLLVQESFSTRVSDIASGFGGSGYPVPVPGGIIRSVQAAGDHLAVLNDTNLYLYNKKGKQVGNFQKMGDNTVLVSSPGRLLTYDVGAKKYAIHSRSKTLLEQDTEYSILAAGINDRGDYAVATSSKQAISEINVYNKKFEHVFSCTFAENFVNEVEVSPRGNMMAASWVNTKDGMLYSGVNLYQLSSDTVKATLELPDNLILGMWYQEEDRIAILTDRQYLFISADGDIKQSYSFGGRQVSHIRQEGKQTLLLLENREARISDIVLLDADLSERASHTTSDKVVDIALSTRRIYVLWENNIELFTLKFEEDKVEDLEHVSRICQAGGKLYYLDRENICQLGQAESQAETDWADDSASGESELDEWVPWQPTGEGDGSDDEGNPDEGPDTDSDGPGQEEDDPPAGEDDSGEEARQ